MTMNLIIILGIYLYIFRNIFIENVTFSKLILRTTFGFVDFKLISHLLLALTGSKPSKLY